MFDDAVMKTAVRFQGRFSRIRAVEVSDQTRRLPHPSFVTKNVPGKVLSVPLFCDTVDVEAQLLTQKGWKRLTQKRLTRKICCPLRPAFGRAQRKQSVRKCRRKTVVATYAEELIPQISCRCALIVAIVSECVLNLGCFQTSPLHPKDSHLQTAQLT